VTQALTTTVSYYLVSGRAANKRGQKRARVWPHSVGRKEGDHIGQHLAPFASLFLAQRPTLSSVLCPSLWPVFSASRSSSTGKQQPLAVQKQRAESALLHLIVLLLLLPFGLPLACRLQAWSNCLCLGPTVWGNS